MNRFDLKRWLRLAAALLSALFCLAPCYLRAQDKLPPLLPLRTDSQAVIDGIVVGE